MKDNEKMTREKIKKTVEDFFSEHSESELTATVYLDSDRKYSICTFHIDAKEREVYEDATKSELMISNYASSLKILFPDSVNISYDEVDGCKQIFLQARRRKTFSGIFWILYLKMAQYWNLDFYTYKNRSKYYGITRRYC